MAGLQDVKRRFFSKAFRIELDDEFCYPNEKNFRFPGKLVVRTAIENYGISNKQTVEFLSEGDPVVFVLDGKEKYQADLELGRSRWNQGYYIMCRQVF